MNYYNENDGKAAACLRELIKAGEIPPGDVDTRSITEISPHELTSYTQQHFFAGIGGWSLALKLAGWPIDRPVRTGSCPCQPFSQTGLGLGEKDERHLFPVFRDLITFGENTVTFGEQVASAAGRVWLARVRADLEGMGYGVGAADLCSASACPEVEGWIYFEDGKSPVPVSSGPPNIRQRLYWMAYAESNGRGKRRSNRGGSVSGTTSPDMWARLADNCEFSRLADADGRESGNSNLQRGGEYGLQPKNGAVVWLGDTNGSRPQGRDERGNGPGERSPWASSVVLPCTDGKARRIEPGSFPLAHGIPGRVGLLRGYGNAINPWLAAEFIEACDDVIS